MEVVEKLAWRVATELDPERIILLGSYAVGEPSPDSDVDLLVVVRHTGKSWQEATRIRNVEASAKTHWRRTARRRLGRRGAKSRLAR